MVTASSRGRPRSPEIDARVKAAVCELLAEVGYGRLAIEQVAQRAGVGKSAIYRRWGSKPAVVFAAVLHDVDLPPPPDTGSLLGDLTAVATTLMTHFSTPSARRAVPGLITDLASDPALVDAFASSYNASELASIDLMLARAVARGELTRSPDSAEVHMLLVGPVYAWLFAYGRPASEAFARRLARVLVAGLSADEEPEDVRDLDQRPARGDTAKSRDDQNLAGQQR